MDEAEYCNRLGLIYRGELIALGTPHAELKAGMGGPRWLSAKRVPLHDGDNRLRPLRSSLEDVFVARIEARDRAEQPQQEVQR